MVRSSQKGALRIALLAALLMMIAACGSSGGGGGGGGPITVSGTVVDSSNTEVSGANIVLNHDDATLVTTGADGAFTFANVTPPYTLTMKSGIVIMEYRNLNRADPKLSTSITGATYMAALAGSVTGPTYPLPAGQGILIGATNGVYITTSMADAAGNYSSWFLWSGSSAKTADLAALRFSVVGSVITSYISIGTRAGVSLNQGVNQSGLDIALSSPVTSASTIFNFNGNAYNTGLVGRYLWLKAGGAKFFVPLIATLASGSTIELPSEGATFMVSGADSGGNLAVKIGAAALGGTTTVDLPSSTVLKNSLPANGAINVSKTPTLSWTPVGSADLYLVFFAGPGVGYGFYLPGSSSSVTIPDYTTLGLPLAGGTNYGWYVLALKASGLSVDGVADPAGGGISALTMYESPTLELYTSAGTNFMTAP